MRLRAFFRETFRRNNQWGCVVLMLGVVLLLALAVIGFFWFWFSTHWKLPM
jgi:hypothetical protein